MFRCGDGRGDLPGADSGADVGGLCVAGVCGGEDFTVLATNPPLDEGKMNASPAVVGDRLLVRTDKAIYCLGK